MEELGPGWRKVSKSFGSYLLSSQKDFQKAQSLLFAEVAFLLDREQNKRAEGNSTEPSELVNIFQFNSGLKISLLRMFMKTLKYTQRFSRFNELETIREVRKYASLSCRAFFS